MTTTADWDRKDRLATLYGVREPGVPVGSEYHSTVDHDHSWTLSEIASRGGKISRVRLLHERGMFDISYIHATLPDGTIVRVNTGHCPESFLILIPKRKFKGVMIAWAREENVFAKGMGLLDESNWSILW